MEDSKLSLHFSLYEFCRTTHAEFWESNYLLAMDNTGKLVLLANDLEYIRRQFGKPIIITSGARCPELNKKIGSTATSQHTRAEAVDFLMHGVKLWDVFEWIVRYSGLKYGQVIHEGSGRNIWIHYSLGEPYRCPWRSCQALVYKEGVYERYSAI